MYLGIKLIKVYWPLDADWYFGRIGKYELESHRHHVMFLLFLFCICISVLVWVFLMFMWLF